MWEGRGEIPAILHLFAKIAAQKAAIIPKRESIKAANFLMALPLQFSPFPEAHIRTSSLFSDYTELQCDIKKRGTLMLQILRGTEGFTDEEIDGLLEHAIDTPQ
jgi:hypothetical protein